MSERVGGDSVREVSSALQPPESFPLMGVPERGTRNGTKLEMTSKHALRPNSTPTPKTKTKTTRTLRTLGLSFAALVAMVAASVILSPTTTANAATGTIWGGSAPAGLVTHSDTASVELGTRFTAVDAGAVAGVRFWKMPSQSGLHVGTLWTSRGKKLATAVFASETAAGNAIG